MYKLRYMVAAGVPETLKLSHWLLCERVIVRLLHQRHAGEAIRINVTDPSGSVCYSHERK